MKQQIYSVAEAENCFPLIPTEATADSPRMYRMEDVDCGDGIVGIRAKCLAQAAAFMTSPSPCRPFT